MDTTLTNYKQASEDYQRIEKAIQFMEENYLDQPSLNEVADSLHMSEYHFQRLFTRWVGISPKRFLQFLTKEHAKELLARSENLLNVAYESGLSGPGRLHDLFINCEAVTPGEFKSQGAGLKITYGFHPTPFGECMLATTKRGICNLIFVEDGNRQDAIALLNKMWKNAILEEDPGVTYPLVQQVFGYFDGISLASLSVYLHGTNFQIKVWEALLRIPPGGIISYENLANLVGRPDAVRAVSNAVARNPIPVLIPCHRVIRKVGDFGGYRYGTARKKALHGWEMSKQFPPATYVTQN